MSIKAIEFFINQNGGHALEAGANRLDLRQNISAGALAGDHPLNCRQLPGELMDPSRERP